MRNFIGAASVFVMATSFVACAETDSTETGGTTDGTVIGMSGGNGSSGTNGLSSDDFMAAQVLLAKSARLYPLVDSAGSKEVNPGIKNLLLGSKSGVAVLRYAIACTVPRGIDIHAADEYMPGLGHLAKGPDWLAGPLSHTAVNELMACMAIHVNAFGVEIPILLSGASIKADPIGHPEFSVSEARWVANVNSDDVPTYTVYASDYVAQQCFNVLSAFKDRVCGQWSAGCNFVVGDSTKCIQDGQGNWTCDKTPAIESWLIPESWGSLYGSCGH
jgi:hypothetical protein